MSVTPAQVERALASFALARRALRGDGRDRPTFAQACRSVNPELFEIMAAAINRKLEQPNE